MHYSCKRKLQYFCSNFSPGHAEPLRTKRQDDKSGGDDGDEQSVEQLCDARPPDEYFRLTTEGDCRDVVR